MLRNKTAIECWNILKYEIESIIVPLEKEGKRSRKKHLSTIAYNKLCGGFIGLPEKMKTTQRGT